MANVKNFKRFRIEGAEKTIVLNQSISIPLYNDLVEIAKEKNFDHVQALSRFVLAEFARKHGQRKKTA